MGCWHATDMVTHLPITCGEKVVLLVLKLRDKAPRSGGYCYPTDMWEPISLPIRGEYNDYGTIENVEEGLSTDLLLNTISLSDEVKKEVVGYKEEENPLRDTLRAIERGLLTLQGTNYSRKGEATHVQKPIHHCMVKEDTWNQMQSAPYEIWGDHPDDLLSELKEGYKDRPDKKHDGYFLWQMRFNEKERMLFARPSIELIKASHRAEDNGKYEEFLDSSFELTMFSGFLGACRRYFCPPASAGSSQEEWECHKILAEMTIKQCDAALKEREEWE